MLFQRTVKAAASFIVIELNPEVGTGQSPLHIFTDKYVLQALHMLKSQQLEQLT